MKKIIAGIDSIIAKIAIWIIYIYQYTLSPDKGLPSLWLKWRICPHEPHCSEYGSRVFNRYWFIKWIIPVIDRVLHCTPSMEKIYDPDHYRVVFFSSAPIGVPFLQHLAEDKKFEVVGVVTMPDAPSGRGMQTQENIIKQEWKKINADLDFIATPAKLNPEKSEEWKKFATWLKKKNPDFLVVIAYGKIIPQPILDIPRIAPINVHGSLLPKYRWASPIQSVFLEGEKETGITIMKMDATMDTWDMLDTIKFKLPFTRTVKEVIEEMKEKWPKLLNSTLWWYGKWLIKEVKQNNEKATYCSKMEKEDGEIVPTKDSLEVVYKKYRAFYLWPKLHFFQKAKNENMLRIIIEKLVLNEKSYEEKKVLPLFDSNWKINECVEEIVLKPEWKKILSREEFLNGYIKK